MFLKNLGLYASMRYRVDKIFSIEISMRVVRKSENGARLEARTGTVAVSPLCQSLYFFQTDLRQGIPFSRFAVGAGILIYFVIRFNFCFLLGCQIYGRSFEVEVFLVPHTNLCKVVGMVRSPMQ